MRIDEGTMEEYEEGDDNEPEYEPEYEPEDDDEWDF